MAELTFIEQVRVARTCKKDGKIHYPSFEGFTPIICLTKSSKYGMLSPYCLKDDENRIMENIWQFSKVYESVPVSRQIYSRYQPRVIWKWPEEIHVRDGKLTPEYYKWREAGMNACDPIRYPVGFEARHDCLGSLLDDEITLLNYIEARKKLYFPLYCRLVEKQPIFQQLKKRLRNGENLLIIEIDTCYDDIDYYKKNYGVDDDFIQNKTMLMTKDSLRIVMNDVKYPAGHGYGLAAMLLDREEWLYQSL